MPFTSFSKNDRSPEGKVKPVWFALDESRPLAFFAGIWTGWTCTRKVAEGEITCELFAFLTTDANAEVGAVHPKAMPVILYGGGRARGLADRTLVRGLRAAATLPAGTLTVVGRGQKKDGPGDLLVDTQPAVPVELKRLI